MTTATLVHRYHPRGACAVLWERHDPEVLLSGPAGTGKSRSCLEKLNLVALKYPGMRGLIVRKVQATLGATALHTWRRDVVAEGLKTGDVEYYGGSAEEPPQYRYANGSRIIIGGMDKASKIMSSEYDMIYTQEATELTEDDWEALTTRLRNWRIPTYQQLIGDCNPDRPTHWLKVRCDSRKTILLESRHEDNPELYDADGNLTDQGASYMAKLDALTGVRYQRLRRGLWVAAEGMIFEGYDPAIHVIDQMPDGWESWTRWLAIDFGYVNPFVCQWWAEDHDGVLHLYREIYRTRRTINEHAKQIRALGDGEARPRAIICDHDAGDRAVLEKELGISTTAADKKVDAGIQVTAKRFAQKRLLICRNALVERDEELVDARKPTCTAEEIPGYVWADHKTKEQPVKEDDHGVDSMRYMVAARDLGGRPRIRFM
jgi:phage terminase large subunit